jgi:hypothetical protein
MGEGLLYARGGASKQTATPSILDFSTASATSIKFKLRNNDSVAATLSIALAQSLAMAKAYQSQPTQQQPKSH